MSKHDKRTARIEHKSEMELRRLKRQEAYDGANDGSRERGIALYAAGRPHKRVERIAYNQTRRYLRVTGSLPNADDMERARQAKELAKEKVDNVLAGYADAA